LEWWSNGIMGLKTIDWIQRLNEAKKDLQPYFKVI